MKIDPTSSDAAEVYREQTALPVASNHSSSPKGDFARGVRIELVPQSVPDVSIVLLDEPRRATEIYLELLDTP